MLIKDLAKVAAALKFQMPKLGSPCALFSIFEGNPLAADHCAKTLHSKVLTRLAKVGANARCTASDLRRSVSTAILELDAELRDSQPGLEGCGAVIALLSGKTLLLASAGKCGATLCGTDPAASFADKAGKPPPNNSWTAMGRPRAMNPEAVAAAAKRAAGVAVVPAGGKDVIQQSWQRLQAKNTFRNIGNPASSGGTFGGAKPGALDPTATKNTRMAAVDKGAGGQFSADDMRIEVVTLSADHHAILLLGSSGLYRGPTPLELATIAASRDRDLAAASMASARLAHKFTVHKTTDDACWVQAEKLAGFEITCVAARLVWNEPLFEKAAPQPKASAEVERSTEAAEALSSEQTLKQRALKRAHNLLTAGPGDALGPQMPGEDRPVKRAPLEVQEFDMDALDSTARWRVTMAKAEHMRGGPQERLESQKGKKGKDGGKKDGGKGKGKDKGKGKKGKKGKGKKGGGKSKEGGGEGGEGSGDEYEEGDYESGDEGECDEGDDQHVDGDVVMGLPPALRRKAEAQEPAPDDQKVEGDV